MGLNIAERTMPIFQRWLRKHGQDKETKVRTGTLTTEALPRNKHYGDPVGFELLDH